VFHYHQRPTEATLRKVMDEATMLRKLRHPNICSFFGTCSVPLPATSAGCIPMATGCDKWVPSPAESVGRPLPGLVLEYLAGGTLGAALGLTTAGSPHEQIASRMLLQLAVDVACGLHFLHSQSIIHCDVKSSNVLLDSSNPPRAKLCDFGISILRRPMDQHESPTGDALFSLGTPRYQAPEITTSLAEKFERAQLCGETESTFSPSLPLNAAMDVYAYGLLLYEILHGCVAFAGRTPVAAMLLASKGERPRLALRPEHAYLAELIQACWDAEPAHRPSMHQVLKVLDPPQAAGT